MDVNIQPGVLARGYVNSTTPFLLSSTSFWRVVFSPSCVSISPPKPARVIESPTATLAAFLAGAAAAAVPLVLLTAVLASGTATALALAAGFAAGDFFLDGGAGAGSTGALRLRRTGGMMGCGDECARWFGMGGCEVGALVCDAT